MIEYLMTLMLSCLNFKYKARLGNYKRRLFPE